MIFFCLSRAQVWTSYYILVQDFKVNNLFALTVPVPSINDPPYNTWDQQDQAPIGESYSSDGSGSLFSMYLDRTILDDREMVEGWKGDADKILIFVGLHATSYTFTYNVEFVDWCILCHSRGIARSVGPKYAAEFAGHLSLLSRTYLSAIERLPTSHPVELAQPH